MKVGTKILEALDAIEYLVEHSKDITTGAEWYRLEDAAHTLREMKKRQEGWGYPHQELPFQ